MTARPIDPLLAGIAGWSLPGAMPMVVPAGEDDARRLVDRAGAEGLLGPLLVAHDLGEVTIPPQALALVVDRQRAALQRCLRVEARLLEVDRWFGEAGGVRHLVIGGPATAHLDAADPSLRTFVGLDLLVAAGDLDRAVAVLVAHGSTRHRPERRAGFDRRFAPSVPMTGEDGVEVELHRSLADGAHGFRIPLADLFDRAERFTLGGRSVACLPPAHRFLHAAYHAVLGSSEPRLVDLRDLAGHLVAPGLGPDVVVPEADRWRGTAVLAVAVRATLDTLSIESPAWHRWVDGYRPDGHESLVIARQRRAGSATGPAVLSGRAVLDGLAELTTTRERAAYVWAMVAPSSAHRRARGRRDPDRLRRRRAVR